ncbi:phosphoribosyl-ATP diphosphatase [Candidatus Vidania fulgoroideae]|uniref:phosphoribosyl-ATP diphosphatase n=1 Tax=Candidatus Vidania fulgoroideorum TaxID=881286 RepID=A0A974X7K4_9PROT|nr:phosphoribosyl-ATP diphosphatase [Candidatus Vidania fulgoroideae]
MLRSLYKSVILGIIKSNSNSYSLKLYKNTELLRRKIIEESYELISESLKCKVIKERIIEESCDLIYHITVYLISFGIRYCCILKELKKRKKPD